MKIIFSGEILAAFKEELQGQFSTFLKLFWNFGQI